MRIAHLSAEVSPFARTGGLGEVVGALPGFQAELGNEVTVWMPLYRQVREELGRRGLTPDWVTDPFEVDLGFARHQIGLLRTWLPGHENVPVYLVGSDKYFDRPHLYSPDIHGKDDGLERYALFVRAAMEAMRRLRLIPAILHAHDWHASLAAMAVAWDRPADWHFGHTASVFTIHNLAYQGVYQTGDFIHLNLPIEARGSLLWRGSLNLLKGALLSADAITTVSPNYAWEITTPEGGFSLDPVVRHRVDALTGILNGIDTTHWDPKTDRRIPFNYDLRDGSGKAENRKTLLTMAGMDYDDPRLVVGIIGRLTEQKGYDLLFPVLEELLNDGVRVVFLGSGDPQLEAQVRGYSHRERRRFWGYVGFDDTLAHLIEAGADAFLMPSRFEPCGLNQLYSLAYGTPPIVRRVGGLVDTVVGYDGKNLEQATGFSFDAPTPWALRDTVRWAAQCHKDPAIWKRIVQNGMVKDFSWHRSAQAYQDLYERVARAR